MREFRELLIEEQPFTEFEFQCSECNNILIELGELTNSAFKNEVLVLYRLQNHTKETNHSSYDGIIEPAHRIQKIDTTITVNNV
jgi:hypothetical protein